MMSAPQLLSADLHSERSAVTLGWSAVTDPSGLRGYRIYRNGRFVAERTQLAMSDVRWLWPGVRYRYTVTAVNALGEESAPSNMLERVCPEPTPVVGTQRLVAIHCHFADWPSVPYPITTFEPALFSAPDSLAGYFAEQSYQQFSLYGECYGWYALPRSAVEYASGVPNIQQGLLLEPVNYPAILADLTPIVGPDIDWAGVAYVVLLIHGLGTVGTTAGMVPGTSAAVIAMTSRIGGALRRVAGHEIGHWLHSGHAGSWQHPEIVGPDLVDWSVGGGSAWRYSDGQDMLGVSDRHFGAAHKHRAGWLTPTRVEGSGEYVLDAYERRSAGAKALLIPLDDLGHAYLVEYRTATGFDAVPSDADGTVDGLLLRVRLAYEHAYLDCDTLRPASPVPLVIVPGQPFLDPHRHLLVECLSKDGVTARVRVTRDYVPVPTPTIPTDTTPPTVTILSPGNGERVARRSTVLISISVADAGGLASIGYTINGSSLPGGTFTSCAWTVPGKRNASYVIRVTAVDLAGHATSASVQVTAR